MDEQRASIVEDLKGLLQGDLQCDPLAVAMYATDGSLYQVPPLGIVYPKHREDVVAVLKYAAGEKLPVIARGAGTGLAGESLGGGLILDFSRHMRQIEWIGEDTVRVQPGVVLSSLNRTLAQAGRYFAPDPSGASVTTVGSMLALDAAGSHSVRVGSTRDHVGSLELVLASGDILEVGSESVEAGPSALPLVNSLASATDGSGIIRTETARGDAVRQTLVRRLARLIQNNAELIARHQPPLLRNRCGYHLRGVLEGQTLHLARMLVGSEGTLGIFTGATLHTTALPAHRGVVLLLFGQMEAAVRAVQSISVLQPSACDLLDRRLLSLAREADETFSELIPADAEAALIVEQTGFSSGQIEDRIRQVIACIKGLPDLSVKIHEAYTPAEVEFLWSLPERVVPLLTRMQGQKRPLPFVEDLAIPPESMQEFLVLSRSVLQKHKVISSLYAHAATGQIHIRPFLDIPTPENAHQLEEIAEDLYQAVFQVGGTISGEHGTGLSRTAFVSAQYGPLYDVFRQVKELFDPDNLLNPGKVINDDPHLTIRNLRPPPVLPPEPVTLQLKWKPDELLQQAARCNGCGRCRTQEPELRMCPLFRIDPSEAATPRAKANLIRQVLTGTLPADELGSPEFKQVADLCFNCKQCQLECPPNVNIPQMMIEAKAAYVAAHGLSGTDWVLAQAHSFGLLGSALSSPANWAMNNPIARWLFEKLFGIARHRKLPPFARRPLMRIVRPEFLQRPVIRADVKPVIYFIDHYANFHDPELGLALLAILNHHRIGVHIPPGQGPSGMAMISSGDLEGAREAAELNIRELADFAREGCTIVCTEPTAAVALRQEYPMLLNHPDAELVASRVVEAGTLLEQLYKAGRLRRDFQSLNLHVGYHTPCHLKALGVGTPLRNLLSLIPDLQIHNIEEGCSGMAGTYGLTREHFRESVKIGWGLISRMRAGDLSVGSTECSGCKMQMEQGTSTPTLHPLKLLALAYGLMPELRERLKPSRRKWLVT